MEVKRWELMPHVYLTYLPARKFKTGVLSAQFITPLAKETASYNALLPAVLHRGTMRCPDMEQLAAAMDRLYGAQISPTIRKRGETQCLGFVASFIDDRFVSRNEPLLEPAAELLGELLLDPVTRGGRFLQEYVEGEKANLADAIRSIRNRRAEMNVPPARRTTLYIVTEKQDLFSAGIPFITRLAYAERVVVLAEEPEGHGSMVSCVTHDAKLFLPMEELVDVDKELARIAKEKEKVQKGLAGVQAKLGNPGFAAKAPEQVVRAEQEKAEKYAALLHQLEESEARLKDL